MVGLFVGLVLGYRDFNNGTKGTGQLIFDVGFLGLVVGALLAMVLIFVVGAWASVAPAARSSRKAAGRQPTPAKPERRGRTGARSDA